MEERNRHHRIGIDLGGSKIEAAAIDKQGKILQRERIPTPPNDYEATVTSTCELVTSMQSQFGPGCPVGIGTPGALTHPQGVMKNCNSVCLNGRPLQADIEAQLGYGIRLENDANCFTLSECHYGNAREFRSCFGVILGTGVGGGIVIDKKLHGGPNAIAGEWGHNPIPDPVSALMQSSRACYCGRQNCIETVLSGPGLEQTAAELFQLDCSAAEIESLLNAGNEQARLCLDHYCRKLAHCLATVINVVDPEVVVLGGGLSNIGLLYERLPRLLADAVFTDRLRTSLVAPEFGDSSGVLGAACLWPGS